MTDPLPPDRRPADPPATDRLPAAPAPAALLEAALYARDLDAAERVYGDLLGLKKIARHADRHRFYRLGAAVLLIFNPEETPKPPHNPALPVPPHGAEGPGHLCFAMDRTGIAALRARLVAAGLEVEAEFDWPNGAHSLYLRDPAGNSVEFAEPRLWAAD
ncbi:MAG: VOC family protein [Pseudodonghicola sp.]